MPVKCSFCRQRYIRPAAYETHLRKAHANLDIILASTIRNPLANCVDNRGTDKIDYHEPSERPDSDYESDLASDPARSEHDTINDGVSYDLDTAVFNNNTSSVAAKLDYPGTNKASGEVAGYVEEHCNLCEDACAPFTSARGFELASWFIESKVSKSQINDYFSSGLGNSASVGYSSMYMLEKHLQSLDPYSSYVWWFEGQVEDDKRTFPFLYCNILGCVRYLLRQITYQNNLVYAPCHEYDQDGKTIYAEMHTADWWWDIQVQFPPSFIRTVANSA